MTKNGKNERLNIYQVKYIESLNFGGKMHTIDSLPLL